MLSVGLFEGVTGALRVRHGDGLEEECQSPTLALLPPAAHVSCDGKVLTAGRLRGEDHAVPVQAEHLAPPPVRQARVELVQPAGLGLQAGGGEYHSTEM